jgi:hypothetical protein
MKEVFADFLRKIVIFSVILSFIAVGLSFLVPKTFFTPVLPYLFLFFLAVTIVSYYILIKAAQQKFIRFLNYYLLTTTVKLLLFIAVLMTYIMLNRNDAVPFALTFFLLYLCYTVFEVVMIIGYSKSLRK